MHYKILRAVNIQIVQKRLFNKDQVRVRFAPSPTGLLHLGGLRTALYNYLFARANNGTFILRIEDTDQSRAIPGTMEKIQSDLLWAGIIADEDPTRGGPMGPYVQSKRLELYKEQVLKLIDNKSAYYCFCTESRLQLLRKEALRSRVVPKYDNRCRHLSTDEVKAYLQKGTPYCIRFKLSSTTEPFDDMIYGRIVHDVAQQEGDPIIVKSDGFPTYHFANVVDDHFMNISHVLRGIEWQISTPKHIMIYKAFNWTPPMFGHLPLILNPDGTKLSKRQNDIHIESFRKQGIFPLAVLNYVVHAGGGFKSQEQGNHYIDSYQQLIKEFDVSKIKPSSGKLIPERLLEYNKLELSKLLANEKNCQFLVERVKKLVLDAFPDRKVNESLQLDEEHILATLNWGRDRISKLDDLVSRDLGFLWVLPTTIPDVAKAGCVDAVKALVDALEVDVVNFDKDSIAGYLKGFAKNNDVSYPLLMKILRNVLSGLDVGPPVGEMMAILGKDRTLLRLKRCIP